jgi:SAM-dependent methyltransferase
MHILLRITPQHSTQYAAMARKLAAPELLASSLGPSIEQVAPLRLAGQDYLQVSLPAMEPNAIMPILSRLGATSEVYELFERVGDVPGPLLRPLEPQFQPFVPVEMAETRRYKGKTNELFTRVLINLAVFAGAYAREYAGRLRILDPLAGGGTTLFLALAMGYDAFGIELARQDVETTAVFVRQYLSGEHIPCKEVDERGRKAGRRYQFTIGAKSEQRFLILAHGDAAQAGQHLQDVPGGPHMHAVVADLPYGIQHFGEVSDLLQRALPTWERLLLPGGSLALAWNATRIERAALIELIERAAHLSVRSDPPYTLLEHPVDRVIKRRDVIVAVKNG